MTDPNRLILVGELNRLGVPPELAHLHGIEVVGDATGGNAALAGKRADTVIRRLKRLGIKNTLQKVVGNANVDTVTVRAAAADPNIVDTYVHKWSRISAAHEFGHMLGLMDEYYGAKSDTVVKQMISDGLLPPDTRGDHLTANPPTTNVQETKGQMASTKLFQDTGLATPDFTLQDQAKSTSMMTGGYELWPQHYVTVWEALTKLTAGEIAAKYWKLS
jgi:hypothetical protein